MVLCGVGGAQDSAGIVHGTAGLRLGRLGPWGPGPDTITQYSGQVLANLQGPGGFMRCHFTLMSPSFGMAGGGVGQCQLPTGTIINAQFPRRYQSSASNSVTSAVLLPARHALRRVS